ncbi:MAG: BatA domain-containing protein [Acidobacteriaceae bacterium]|nr:BatA domain-containing protein [Acidobacteriaceae bacterium]
MGFLSPWFLAGIAAVGLPLWLHLLRQFKRTPRPFSSLMFFERRIQSSTKHRRLRYLALLALRMAVLILLALAFANPFLNRTALAVKRRTLTVIAVDRSFSMRYRNHMQEAIAKAHQLVNRLPGRSFAEVIAVGSRVEALTRPETDKSVLNAAIDSIQATDDVSSYGEFTRALRVTEQTIGMRVSAHFISDMQQTSMPSNFNDLRLNPQTALELYNVANPAAPNSAVVSVNAPAHVYDPAQTRVTATLAAWHTPAGQRKVSLVLDGKVVGSKQVTVSDCGPLQVEFFGFDVPYGAHRGEIRIEPHDSLPNDDSYRFSIERSDMRKVLFLYAGARSRDAFYYKAAMESSKASGLTVQPAPIGQASNEDFTKFAFVVLNDPGILEEGLERELQRYVSKGGSLLIAAGPQTVRKGSVPVTADKIAATSQTQGAGFVESTNPILGSAAQFQNVQFAYTPRMMAKPGERVIARFADGSPLLVECRLGEGRVLIFASTLDNSANDFPLHTSFLPFVAQTGAYLSGAQDNPSSVVVGAPVALRHTRMQTTAADVIGPDGKHELSLSEAARALSYEPAREGFYEVQAANGRRELAAVNADRRESDLTQVPAEVLALWRNTGTTAMDPEPGSAERQTIPYSLWRYVLLVLLAAAIIESVFASRYLQQERQTT